MKKIIAFGSAALLLGACGESRPTYLLSGLVDTLYNGASVSLLYNDKNDSTVVSQGTFTFKGVIDTPVLARVVVTQGKDRTGGMVVLEKGMPVLTLTEEGASCSGTPLNEAFDAYNSSSKKLYRAFRDTYASLQERNGSDKELEEGLKEARQVYAAEAKKLNEAFFTDNKDNVLGATALLQLAKEKGQFDSLYNVAGEVVRNSERVVKEKTRYENLDKTAAGKPFVDFTIEHGNADGTPVSLSDYVGKGKYVLVDFWASWCGPCRGEMPNLAEVYKKYKGDRFEIVGIAVWDKREDTQKVLESLPISWPVIFDADKLPTDLYGINGIPQIILFGPNGMILERDLRGEQIGKKVGEYLAKQ